MYGALNRALYKNNNNRFEFEEKFGRVRVRIKLTNKERLE